MLLPEGVKLLKLIWHPVDLEGDKVLPTAFRKEDLCGSPDAHVSVDRGDMAERVSMEAVSREQYARGQEALANGRDLGRENAKIGEMVCGEVKRQLIDGVVTFDVRPRPITGNDAHCGIENISGFREPKSKKNRAFFDEAKSKLAKLASPAISFDEAYSR